MTVRTSRPHGSQRMHSSCELRNADSVLLLRVLSGLCDAWESGLAKVGEAFQRLYQSLRSFAPFARSLVCSEQL